jgi:ABC-type transporter Mla subunit MlaD
VKTTIGLKVVATASLWAMLLGACSQGLSKEDYIKQADQICAGAEKEFNDLEQPQSLEDLEGFIDQAGARTNALISDLRDLEPPDEIADEADAMLDNLEQAADSFPDLLAAAKSQDGDRIQQIDADIKANVDAANEAAQSIGLQDCGDTGPTG